MSNYETLDVAQQRALIEAQRNAVEQAGVYIQSITQVRHSQVTYDEIVSIASNVIKIKNKTFKKAFDSAGNVVVKAIIITTIDTAAVDQGLRRSDLAEIVKNYKILKAENERQKQEIANLKRQLQDPSLKTNKKEIRVKLNQASKNEEAIQLLKELNRLNYEGKKAEALSLCSKIVGIIPTSPLGYLRRASLLNKNNYYSLAIDDLNKAISYLNSESLHYLSRKDEIKQIYMLRSACNLKLKKYQEALLDMSNAIEADINDGTLYVWRAGIYFILKDYQACIDDTTRAIPLLSSDINNNLYSAFEYRAYAYMALGYEDKANADLKKLKELRKKS